MSEWRDVTGLLLNASKSLDNSNPLLYSANYDAEAAMNAVTFDPEHLRTRSFDDIVQENITDRSIPLESLTPSSVISLLDDFLSRFYRFLRNTPAGPSVCASYYTQPVSLLTMAGMVGYDEYIPRYGPLSVSYEPSVAKQLELFDHKCMPFGSVEIPIRPVTPLSEGAEAHALVSIVLHCALSTLKLSHLVFDQTINQLGMANDEVSVSFENNDLAYSVDLESLIDSMKRLLVSLLRANPDAQKVVTSKLEQLSATRIESYGITADVAALLPSNPSSHRSIVNPEHFKISESLHPSLLHIENSLFSFSDNDVVALFFRIRLFIGLLESFSCMTSKSSHSGVGGFDLNRLFSLSHLIYDLCDGILATKSDYPVPGVIPEQLVQQYLTPGVFNIKIDSIEVASKHFKKLAYQFSLICQLPELCSYSALPGVPIWETVLGTPLDKLLREGEDKSSSITRLKYLGLKEYVQSFDILNRMDGDESMPLPSVEDFIHSVFTGPVDSKAYVNSLSNKPVGNLSTVFKYVSAAVDKCLPLPLVPMSPPNPLLPPLALPLDVDRTRSNSKLFVSTPSTLVVPDVCLLSILEWQRVLSRSTPAGFLRGWVSRIIFTSIPSDTAQRPSLSVSESEITGSSKNSHVEREAESYASKCVGLKKFSGSVSAAEYLSLYSPARYSRRTEPFVPQSSRLPNDMNPVCQRVFGRGKFAHYGLALLVHLGQPLECLLNETALVEAECLLLLLGNTMDALLSATHYQRTTFKNFNLGDPIVVRNNVDMPTLYAAWSSVVSNAMALAPRTKDSSRKQKKTPQSKLELPNFFDYSAINGESFPSYYFDSVAQGLNVDFTPIRHLLDSRDLFHALRGRFLSAKSAARIPHLVRLVQVHINLHLQDLGIAEELFSLDERLCVHWRGEMLQRQLVETQVALHTSLLERAAHPGPSRVSRFVCVRLLDMQAHNRGARARDMFIARRRASDILASAVDGALVPSDPSSSPPREEMPPEIRRIDYLDLQSLLSVLRRFVEEGQAELKAQKGSTDPDSTAVTVHRLFSQAEQRVFMQAQQRREQLQRMAASAVDHRLAFAFSLVHRAYAFSLITLAVCGVYRGLGVEGIPPELIKEQDWTSVRVLSKGKTTWMPPLPPRFSEYSLDENADQKKSDHPRILSNFFRHPNTHFLIRVAQDHTNLFEDDPATRIEANQLSLEQYMKSMQLPWAQVVEAVNSKDLWNELQGGLDGSLRALSPLVLDSSGGAQDLLLAGIPLRAAAQSTLRALHAFRADLARNQAFLELLVSKSALSELAALRKQSIEAYYFAHVRRLVLQELSRMDRGQDDARFRAVEKETDLHARLAETRLKKLLEQRQTKINTNVNANAAGGAGRVRDRWLADLKDDELVPVAHKSLRPLWLDEILREARYIIDYLRVEKSRSDYEQMSSTSEADEAQVLPFPAPYVSYQPAIAAVPFTLVNKSGDSPFGYFDIQFQC